MRVWIGPLLLPSAAPRMGISLRFRRRRIRVEAQALDRLGDIELLFKRGDLSPSPASQAENRGKERIAHASPVERPGHRLAARDFFRRQVLSVAVAIGVELRIGERSASGVFVLVAKAARPTEQSLHRRAAASHFDIRVQHVVPSKENVLVTCRSPFEYLKVSVAGAVATPVAEGTNSAWLSASPVAPFTVARGFPGAAGVVPVVLRIGQRVRPGLGHDVGSVETAVGDARRSRPPARSNQLAGSRQLPA